MARINYAEDSFGRDSLELIVAIIVFLIAFWAFSLGVAMLRADKSAIEALKHRSGSAKIVLAGHVPISDGGECDGVVSAGGARAKSDEGNEVWEPSGRISDDVLKRTFN